MANAIQQRPEVTAHKHSTGNRQSLAVSDKCGCFYCLKQFHPREITEWTDNRETAICPHCGIDSVIASADTELDSELLNAMQKHWFDE